MILTTLLLRQKIALPLLMAAYRWRRGGYSVRFSFAYGFATWLMIIGFDDYMMGLSFQPSWLGLK